MLNQSLESFVIQALGTFANLTLFLDLDGLFLIEFLNNYRVNCWINKEYIGLTMHVIFLKTSRVRIDDDDVSNTVFLGVAHGGLHICT